MSNSHSKFYAFEFVPSAKKEWKRAIYALSQWQRWKNIGVNLPLSGEQETSLTNPSDEARMNSISIALQAASISPNYTQSYPGKSEVTLLRLDTNRSGYTAKHYEHVTQGLERRPI